MTTRRPYANGKDDKSRGIDYIGIACAFICHDGKGNFVLQKRSQHCRDEQGAWDCGGGAHEFGATLEETARREIQEEYGATVKQLELLKVYDAHRQLTSGQPTHWVAVLFAAQVDPQQVKNNEPYKIDELDWFTLETVPSNLHSQLPHSLAAAHAAGLI